jgi:hypothetical protein
VTLGTLGSYVTFLVMLGLWGCSTTKERDIIPTVGTTLTRVSVDAFGRYHAGRAGSGFGDGCSILLQDPKTGGRYLLVRSQVATATSKSSAADTTPFLMAMGEYAPLSGDTLRGPPEAQFRVDCLKSQVVDSSSVPDPR